MGVTHAIEKYQDCIDEASAYLFKLHVAEVGLPDCELDVDHEAFLKCEQAGMLKIYTMRCKGVLVGYWAGFVRRHLHYKSAPPMAFTDVYFINPKYRYYARGFFKFVHKQLKADGCIYLFNRGKAGGQNHACEFLELMGYEEQERGFRYDLR